ncbi:MAG: hypothetical protein ACLFUT_13000 [Desulfobacteraceae bacterium]
MLCEECKFWEAEQGNPAVGHCHRHAPRSTSVAPTRESKVIPTVWPRTGAGDWCGEWEAKVEVEPEVSY